MNEVPDIADIKLASIEDGCRQLATLLGLGAPVAPGVLVAALQSEEYARNLLTCRRTPAFLAVLLDNPVRMQPQELHADQGTMALMKTASQALARWSKVGFSVVDDAVRERRLHACLVCPNLRTSGAAQPLAFTAMQTHARCALCGCDVEKKARMASEMCPGEDPGVPGQNRWGQLLRR